LPTAGRPPFLQGSDAASTVNDILRTFGGTDMGAHRAGDLPVRLPVQLGRQERLPVSACATVVAVEDS
jgi:hypothetical protein